MKRIYTILVAVLLTASVFAQSPEKMSYQAVIRDASNQLITNTQIGMQVSILETTASGMAVYVETHSPTSNSNGLISIEIGDGMPVSGDFSTIDWANNTFFIQTETDVAGGTNYTIVSVNQLLSVPYALHSKTAESITGGITETDPVYSSSVAGNINSTDISNWDNKLDAEIDGDVTNELQTISRLGLTVTLSNGGGTFQDSVNTYVAGDGIEIVGNTISEKKYQLGDFVHGGIVFWIDETGEHGLVCAKTDQSSAIRWNAGTGGHTQSKGDGIYAGGINTPIIISSTVAIGDDGNDYAARIINEAVITEAGVNYGDWYLPSREELLLMMQKRSIVNATATANGGTNISTSGYYWSSTEVSSNYAYRVNYLGSNVSYLKTSAYHVRGIRAF